jgi:hypothetical protein
MCWFLAVQQGAGFSVLQDYEAFSRAFGELYAGGFDFVL